MHRVDEQSMSGADLLTLDRVSMSRGASRVLSDFSLSVSGCAHHAVVGPSGAGKSTLLALICGILKPDAGRIVFCGKEMSGLSEAQRDAARARSMGVVFQTLGLASALTVEANLALAQRMAGQAQDADFADTLLIRLGLDARRHAKPRHLSRGEAQRAAIARALIVKPTLLVADEPTASLDMVWRDKVMDLVFEQAQTQDTTLIVSTHDPSLGQRFAQQIALPQGEST